MSSSFISSPRRRQAGTLEWEGNCCMVYQLISFFTQDAFFFLPSMFKQRCTSPTTHKGMGLSQTLLLTHCDARGFRTTKFAFAALEYSFISCYNTIMSIKFKNICKTVFLGIIFQNLCEYFFSCHLFSRDMRIQSTLDSSAQNQRSQK